MNHTEEVQIVKKALELEQKAQRLQNDFQRILTEPEPSAPSVPRKATIEKPAYPVIKSELKFKWVVALVPMIILFSIGFLFMENLMIINVLCSLAAWAWLVVCIKKHKKAKEDNIVEIMNSPEYKEKCADIDRKYQSAIDTEEIEYTEKMKEYNSKMESFNQEFTAWKSKHEEELAIARKAKDDAEQELKSHYETTQLIPAKYHSTVILEYIYSVINSSQYTLKECFDDYERNESRKLEEQRIREQQLANQIAEAQANLTAEQNALLNEQNDIAEKTRRDQNIANVVRTIQHHNTNKLLKGK